MKNNNEPFTIAVTRSSMTRHSNNKQHSVEVDDNIMSDIIARSNTISTVNNLENTSQEEMRKLISTLGKMLNEANQQKQQLEQKLQKHIKRSIQREKEFYRIIQGYVETNNSSFNSNSNNNKFSQDDHYHIKKLHSQLTNRVQQNDQKLKQKYQQLYQQNIKLMERKICSLTQKMQRELKKSKQITNGETVQMRGMMVKLGDMAVEVEGRNEELVKKNNQLELKLQLVNQEKKLLLEEICQKKNMLRSYHNKCKEYEFKLRQKQRNSVQSIMKNKSISQATDHNNNNKSTHEQARKTISFGIGFDEKGAIVSDFLGDSRNKNTLFGDSSNKNNNNSKIENSNSNRQQKLISRNFSVNTTTHSTNNNNNNKISSSYSQHKHYISQKKRSAQLNKLRNPVIQQQSENNIKIFSTQFVNSHNAIKLETLNGISNNVGRKSKKDYISSMSITGANSPLQQKHNSINKIIDNNESKNAVNFSNNNYKLTTSTTQQSSQQVLLFIENSNNNNNNHNNSNSNKTKLVIRDNSGTSQQNTGCNRELNAVNSIRKVASRQKQKKLQYMGKLAELQRKLTIVDGLVSDALIVLSEMDQNKNYQPVVTEENKSNHYKQQNEKQQQQHINNSKNELLVFVKVLCDQLKNTISTNYNSTNLTNSNITQNYYYNHNYNYTSANNQLTNPNYHISSIAYQHKQPTQVTTSQLIQLLDAELNPNRNQLNSIY